MWFMKVLAAAGSHADIDTGLENLHQFFDKHEPLAQAAYVFFVAEHSNPATDVLSLIVVAWKNEAEKTMFMLKYA